MNALACMLMNGLNPPLVREFHERKHVSYSLRTENLCKLLPIKAMNFGLDSGSFRWRSLDGSITQKKI